MNGERYQKIKELFLAACQKPHDERSAFLAETCRDDDHLRREVEALLAEHESNAQVLPSEPEGPLGPMSALLSRAGIDALPSGSPGGEHRASARGDHHQDTRYLEESLDQTTGSRSGIVDAGRFMAGTVVAGRYRIIELLGRGGMGEVYRADDITLNQSIALKFLPALFGSDLKWLERFRNEVRLSRQVTHPNVCRVFDIGEFQGEQFISMEYVDGENLASLLRRIGRIPHDKAVHLARQLCAGLAAAHDRGVLHRDLKPANVMIDGRGSVRITDFGLAAPADQYRREAGGGGGARAGTPAYMSPEQLAGKPVTVRSDIYSLGLVIYEMFTGRRAFRADNLREYQRLHSSADPTPPSEITGNIDPIVERVILRCLKKDPQERPASVMAVSASLPGGNPLREILAAGETPSPEVVAAAGEAHRVMRPSLAIALFVTALACLIGFVHRAPSIFVVQRALHNTRSQTPIRAEPSILTYKARETLRNLGYTNPPRDSAWGFEANRGYYLYIEKSRAERRLWMLARPRLGLIYFWYRQSPELLVPLRPDGFVAERDPPPVLPGMVTVRLDTQGRLIGLEVQPTTPAQSVVVDTQPASEDAAVPRSFTMGRADWSALLKAAGINLNEGRFVETRPRGTPPVYADERIAWRGSFQEGGSRDEVRIEAAALGGNPVYFAIIGSWQEEPLSEDQAAILSVGKSNLLMQTIVLIAVLAVGSFLAWRNYRSGRGDRQGATRMGLAFLLLGMIAWLFQAHHVPDPNFEFILFQRGVGPVLYFVGLVWVLYMALEPYVRRIWPETVISWSRFLAGKWFDPMVGRDVLAGTAVGVMSTLLAVLEYQIPQWVGQHIMPVPLPSITSVTFMLGTTRSYSGLFSSAIGALYLGLILLLFLVIVRMFTHRRWIGAVLFIVLFAISTAHYRVDQPSVLGPENWLSLVIQGLLATILLILLARNGLVAVIFCLLARAFLMDFPVTWDLSAWYADASLAGILTVVVIMGFSFYNAIGGKAGFHLHPADK